MEFGSRSFRLERGSSLVSESISSECARIAGYERLSQSMRISCLDKEGTGDGVKSRKNRTALGFMVKVFHFRKLVSGTYHDQATTQQQQETMKGVNDREEKKIKKRSSWFPDPERRWPVQGW